MRHSFFPISFRSLVAGASTLCAALLLGACASTEQPAEPSTGESPLQVVATTGMLGDAAAAIVGDLGEIEVLMGPEVDPHYYIATQGDLRRLRAADVVIYNGLRLEGKMSEVLEGVGRTKPVVAIADRLPESSFRNVRNASGTADALIDPHIWFDVKLWADGVVGLANDLAEAFPEHAGAFRANAADYRAELLSLDEDVRAIVAGIPDDRRVLITSHDAFGYFGRAYGLEVRGLLGVSTVSEFSLKDRIDLVDYIIDQRIPAVFIESSVSPKDLQAVIEGCRDRGHAVRIGGQLFSDALGPAGTPEGNYPGMVQFNARTIADGLSEEGSPAAGKSIDNTDS